MVVYVDSWLLRGITAMKPGTRTVTMREFTKLRNPSYTAVIPQIALGETISTMMRDMADDANAFNTVTKKLFDSIANILDVSKCMPPPSPESFEIAHDLKHCDGSLDITDLLIVSQALADPDSQLLLTADGKLVHSMAIKCKDAELYGCDKRRSGLRLADRL